MLHQTVRVVETASSQIEGDRVCAPRGEERNAYKGHGGEIKGFSLTTRSFKEAMQMIDMGRVRSLFLESRSLVMELMLAMERGKIVISLSDRSSFSNLSS